MTRMFAALLTLVLGACAYIAPLQPPATFYVMRHFDTPAGVQDPGLTEEGKRKAQPALRPSASSSWLPTAPRPGSDRNAEMRLSTAPVSTTVSGLSK